MTIPPLLLPVKRISGKFPSSAPVLDVPDYVGALAAVLFPFPLEPRLFAHEFVALRCHGEGLYAKKSLMRSTARSVSDANADRKHSRPGEPCKTLG